MRGQAIVVAERGLRFLDATVSFSLMIGTAPSSSSVTIGIAGVQVACAIVQIIGREQDLGGVMAVGAQRRVRRLDQEALSDRRHGLQAGPGRWAGCLSPSRPMPAPTAPELTSTTCRPAIKIVTDLFGQLGDLGFVESALLVGQHARAHLDDDRVRRGGDFLSQEIGHESGAIFPVVVMLGKASCPAQFTPQSEWECTVRAANREDESKKMAHRESVVNNCPAAYNANVGGWEAISRGMCPGVAG